jgi:hypothetical protein
MLENTRGNQKARFLFFYVNGSKWGQEKHTDIFGHHSSIFPLSPQTSSGTCHNKRYFPSPGDKRRRSATEAISGPRPTHRTAPNRPAWTSTCLADLKTTSRPVISIWRHRQSRGPEVASGAGCLLLPPGFEKSHRLLWQVPEQVWGLSKKIGDWYPEISVCFSCVHLTSIHAKKMESYFVTSPRMLKTQTHVHVPHLLRRLSNEISFVSR